MEHKKSKHRNMSERRKEKRKRERNIERKAKKRRMLQAQMMNEVPRRYKKT